MRRAAATLAAALLAASAAGAAGAAVTPALADPAAAAPLRAAHLDLTHPDRVGVVVTVPGDRRPDGFTATVDGVPVNVDSRPVTGLDLAVVVAPTTSATSADSAGSAASSAEAAGLTGFLLDLPTGTATDVLPVNPASPANPPAREPSADVGTAVAALAQLPVDRRASVPDTERLTAAADELATAHRLGRTLVLVTGPSDAASRAALADARRRLAASGTTLFVLDTTAHGSPLDPLAEGTGGTAFRLGTHPSATSFTAALDEVTAELTSGYYLTFAAPGGPRGASHTAAILVTTAGVTQRIDVPLVAAPAMPPAPPARRPGPRRDRWLAASAALLIVAGLGYSLAMLIASRRTPRRYREAAVTPASPNDLFFVFVLPCLNEERVIANSVARLRTVDADNYVIMVVDDGSDDTTPAVVGALAGDDVWLLRRTLPDARQGKGEAMNAAVAHLLSSGVLAGRDPDQVVLVVVDADGRIDPHAVRAVIPYFADPTVGGVQIGVRINNRHTSRLARMQDMEFVIYTEVFQRGRRHLDSVGLGGNGQFMRLSALTSLGPKPWSRSLTEDLDLGIRLLAGGWRTDFCPTAAVHQQGVVELRRLVTQRSRWFQGHLQSWRLVPLVVRAAPRRARADLLYHLSSPALLLIASLLTGSFVLSVAASVALAVSGRNPVGWWLVTTYALSFGPALAYSTLYWRKERSEGLTLLRAWGLAHLYVGYGLMWYAAGWRAVGRILRGADTWAKTERTAEEPAPVPARSATPQPVEVAP